MGVKDANGDRGRTLPKSVRHKRILEIAAERPDASLEEIAEPIPSATSELVENVLEEYGDPAERDVAPEKAVEPTVDAAGRTERGSGSTDADTTETDAETDASAKTDEDVEPDVDAGSDESTESDEDIETNTDTEASAAAENDDPNPPDPDALTDTQRETLRAIHDHPEATQREIGALLDVTAATVCNRASTIDGFSWKNRAEITREVFGDDGGADAGSDANGSSGTDERGDETAASSDVDDETDPGSVPGDDSVADADSETNAENGANDDANTDGNAMTTGSPGREGSLEELEDRIAALEQGVGDAGGAADPVFTDPELAHKIVHACLKSDVITEDEELRIIESLLDS